MFDAFIRCRLCQQFCIAYIQRIEARKCIPTRKSKNICIQPTSWMAAYIKRACVVLVQSYEIKFPFPICYGKFLPKYPFICVRIPRKIFCIQLHRCFVTLYFARVLSRSIPIPIYSAPYCSKVDKTHSLLSLCICVMDAHFTITLFAE